MSSGRFVPGIFRSDNGYREKASKFDDEKKKTKSGARCPGCGTLALYLLFLQASPSLGYL